MGTYLYNNFVSTQGHGDNWAISFDKPQRRVKTYFEESCIGMQLLNEQKKDLRFKLFLSGGVDSLYIANLLLYMNYDFDAVIINNVDYFGNSYSMHDIKYALEFCSNRGIDPEVITFNFDEFVESGEILEIANDAKCCVVPYAVPLKIMKDIDGFVLLGSSPPIIKQVNDTWYFADYEFSYAVNDFMNNYNIQGCSAATYYTPEMFVSFLNHKKNRDLSNNKHPGKLSNTSSKSFIFNDNSFFKVDEYDFKKGERIKLTGYETVMGGPIGQHANIKEFDNLTTKWNGIYKCEYNQFMQQFQKYV